MHLNVHTDHKKNWFIKPDHLLPLLCGPWCYSSSFVESKQMGYHLIHMRISEPWAHMTLLPIDQLSLLGPFLVGTNYWVPETPQQTCCFEDAWPTLFTSSLIHPTLFQVLDNQCYSHISGFDLMADRYTFPLTLQWIKLLEVAKQSNITCTILHL